MRCCNFSRLVKTQTRIEYLFASFYPFWNTATNNISLSFFSKLTEQLTCLPRLADISFTNFLRIQKHMLACVGANKHFRQHDDISTSRSGFSDHSLSTFQIGCFLSHCFDLTETEFKHLRSLLHLLFLSNN